MAWYCAEPSETDGVRTVPPQSWAGGTPENLLSLFSRPETAQGIKQRPRRAGRRMYSLPREVMGAFLHQWKHCVFLRHASGEMQAQCWRAAGLWAPCGRPPVLPTVFLLPVGGKGQVHTASPEEVGRGWGLSLLFNALYIFK